MTEAQSQLEIIRKQTDKVKQTALEAYVLQIFNLPFPYTTYITWILHVALILCI